MRRALRKSPNRSGGASEHAVLTCLRSSDTSHLNRLEQLIGDSVQVSFSFFEPRDENSSDSSSSIESHKDDRVPSAVGRTLSPRSLSMQMADVEDDMRRHEEASRRRCRRAERRRVRRAEREAKRNVRTVRACLHTNDPPRIVTSPRACVSRHEAVEMAALVFLTNINRTDEVLDELSRISRPASASEHSPRYPSPRDTLRSPREAGLAAREDMVPSPMHGYGPVPSRRASSSTSSSSSASQPSREESLSAPAALHRATSSDSRFRRKLSLSDKLRVQFKSDKGRKK